MCSFGTFIVIQIILNLLEQLSLGAGLGVSGLKAAQLGASRVVLSDNVDELLMSLNLSVTRNCSNEAKLRMISVKSCDWSFRSQSNPSEFSNIRGEQFDFIFGADILYEPDFAKLIPEVLKRHLRIPSQRVRSISTALALFVIPTRSVSILNNFLQTLSELLDFSVDIFSAKAAASDLKFDRLVCGKNFSMVEDNGRHSVDIDESVDDCMLIFCW